MVILRQNPVSRKPLLFSGDSSVAKRIARDAGRAAGHDGVTTGWPAFLCGLSRSPEKAVSPHRSALALPPRFGMLKHSPTTKG